MKMIVSMDTGFFFGKHFRWRESLATHVVVGPDFLTPYTLHPNFYF